MSAATAFRGSRPAMCEVPVGALYGALHDDLTSLLTRDAWWVGATQALAAGSAGPLLLLDVDHVKWWNDEHGHPTGDKVLAAVAGVLRSELRHADVIGRLGGDEFVVLLSGRRDAADTQRVVQRLRHCIAGVRVRPPAGEADRGLTVSIGAALCPDRVADLDELIDVADRAMYRVKHNGGDGVAVVQVGEPQCGAARVGAGHG